MFATKESYRVDNSSLDEGPDMAYWDLIELPDQAPWFVVSFVESKFPRSSGELMRRTVLLHKREHLVNLIRSLMADQANIENVQAQVIIPRYMAGTSRWSMEPLAAVMTGNLPDDESEEFDVFETTNGSRFAEHMSVEAVGRLKLRPRLTIASP